ncbi:MAG TPA: hypothetical protein VGB77_05580 [Abditibacteriaceae bacterium]
MNTRIVMRYANSAFLALTFLFAVGFLVTSYRVALAYGPGDGVCANLVDNTTACPANTIATNYYYCGWTCMYSSTWYADFFDTTGYQNCCRYEGEDKVCTVRTGQQSATAVAAGKRWFFRSNSNGWASCRPDTTCLFN